MESYLLRLRIKRVGGKGGKKEITFLAGDDTHAGEIASARIVTELEKEDSKGTECGATLFKKIPIDPKR